MRNGDINSFVEHLHFGDELLFNYRGKSYFVQAGEDLDTHIFHMVLFLYSEYNPASPYIWEYEAKTPQECAEQFLKAKLWDGRTFMDAEYEMEWVDDPIES